MVSHVVNLNAFLRLPSNNNALMSFCSRIVASAHTIRAWGVHVIPWRQSTLALFGCYLSACSGGGFQATTTGLSSGTTLPSVAGPGTTQPPVMVENNVFCAGDGVTDDFKCLSDAISNAGKTNNLLVLQKGKTYLTQNVLAMPDNVQFNGNGATLIAGKISAGGSLLKINGKNVVVRNLNLKSLQNINAAIEFGFNVQDAKILSNNVTGFFSNGIYLGGKGQSNILIDGNKIDGGKDRAKGSIIYGILLNSLNLGISVADYPHHITISNNTVLNVTADAIEINSPVHAMAPQGSTREGVAANNIVISNNTLSAPYAGSPGAGMCIGIAGAFEVMVSGNKMSECKWQGIHIEDRSYNVTLELNTIQNIIAAPGSLYSPCIYAMNSKNVKILNNNLSQCFNSGIYLVWNAEGMNESFTIAGNRISSNTETHIKIVGDGKTRLNMIIGDASNNRSNDNVFSGSVREHVMACDPSVRGSNIAFASKRTDDVGGNGGTCTKIY